MSDELTIRHMPKFDGSDFTTWKFQITRLFIANGLLEIINGTRQKPMTAGAVLSAWERESAKAMFAISSSMRSNSSHL